VLRLKTAMALLGGRTVDSPPQRQMSPRGTVMPKQTHYPSGSIGADPGPLRTFAE